MVEKSQDPKGEPISGEATGGIFITRGMRVSIPAGGIKFDFSQDGGFTSSITLHLSLDMCPYWLEIAQDHLIQAEIGYTQAVDSSLSDDSQNLSNALEAEFTSGMQAIMASAIAMDAFYARVKESITIPQSTLEAWQRNGTARFVQMTEALKIGFALKRKTAQDVQEILKQVTTFRDRAVHPDSKVTQAVYRADIKRAVEWRFVSFGFPNAKAASGLILSVLAQIIMIPKPKNKELKNYCTELSLFLEPIVHRWEARYGLLYPRNDG